MVHSYFLDLKNVKVRLPFDFLYLSARRALHFGPNFMRTGTVMFATVRNKPTIVNIQPIPTPSIPGSIETEAIALFLVFRYYEKC